MIRRIVIVVVVFCIAAIDFFTAVIAVSTRDVCRFFLLFLRTHRANASSGRMRQQCGERQ